MYDVISCWRNSYISKEITKKENFCEFIFLRNTVLLHCCIIDATGYDYRCFQIHKLMLQNPQRQG